MGKVLGKIRDAIVNLDIGGVQNAVGCAILAN